MLKIDIQKPIAKVTLDRPDLHNAFNDELIRLVTGAFTDIAIAAATTQFGFTEVRVGIIPSVVSPFVIARIGTANAREYFLTGERFTAEVARSIGLIQHVAPDEAAIDTLIQAKVAEILKSSPNAVTSAKEVIFGVAGRSPESVLDFTADAIARARASEDGRAGIAAFLSRSRPPWVPLP